MTDKVDAATYIGFIKFVANNYSFSMDQFFSLIFIAKFFKKNKKLIPNIDASMFVKVTSGIRAQAMD